MRAWLIAAVVLFAGTLYFIVFPETKLPGTEKPKFSKDNPFFSPKLTSVPFGSDLVDYGNKLTAEEKFDEAVAVFGKAYMDSTAADKKAAAMLGGGLALVQRNDPSSTEDASEVFEEYLRQFPHDSHADMAHYYLGAIAADTHQPEDALAHFTTIIADFPMSGFRDSAIFHSKNLAGLLAKEEDTFKERVLNILGPLIPRNPAALATLLGYLVSILGWLAYDWKRVRHVLLEEKHPAAWATLILSVVLIAVNYTREWSHSASLLDLPKILQH